MEDKSIVDTAYSFKDHIGKDLYLGMSDFVCRYGTLSDGHNILTDFDRYRQAKKESYVRAVEIKRCQARLRKIRAKKYLYEGKAQKAKGYYKTELYGAIIDECNIEIHNLETTLSDTKRQLKVFFEESVKLEGLFKSKYNSIEDAELDSWITKARYNDYLKQLGVNPGLSTNVPLPMDVKARIGLESKASPELTAWFLSVNHDELQKSYQGNIKVFLEDSLSKGLITNGKNILP